MSKRYKITDTYAVSYKSIDPVTNDLRPMDKFVFQMNVYKQGQLVQEIFFANQMTDMDRKDHIKLLKANKQELVELYGHIVIQEPVKKKTNREKIKENGKATIKQSDS